MRFMFNHKGRLMMFGWMAAAVALAMLWHDPLLAAKPGGGGSGGGDTGGGTIYFNEVNEAANAYEFRQMNSDGSGKTTLPIPAGEPSHTLHGGHRWFLRVEPVPGSFPDGRQREEIFAYRDDGALLQLTNDPDVEGFFNFNILWQPGDDAISWVAQRWDSDTGQVVEEGVYEAVLVYDGSGNLTGIIPWSVMLILSEPDIGWHDWSPDGTRIVYDLQTTNELWIADVVTDDIDLLYVGPATQAVWSPDGSTIAFKEAVYVGDIMTIKSDGSGLTTIVLSNGYGPSGGGPKQASLPRWSPTGSHLVYSVWWSDGFGPAYNDVYRAKANGGGKSNLTPDSDYARPIGWR
jgi:hypothetical protein